VGFLLEVFMEYKKEHRMKHEMHRSGEMKSGENMRSDYKTKEGGVMSETADLHMHNREPEAHQLGSATDGGNPMSRAVDMVHRHNERHEHAPEVCGHKMHQ